MRYNLFFALLLLCFGAQAQYNSSRELLKDTNIVWAARFEASVVPFTIDYWDAGFVYPNVLNPSKFVNTYRQTTTTALGGNFNFLLDGAFWAAHPKQFFSDDSLRRATDFNSSCLMGGEPIYREGLDGEMIMQITKQPYNYSYIYSYQLQTIVYYSLKTQRFACYIESIAPNGLKWNWDFGDFGEQTNLFYFNMQSSNLNKRQNLQQSDIIQAVWSDISIPLGELQPIISKWDLDKVLKAYFKHLRNDRNAQKQLVIPNPYLHDPIKGAAYKQNYLNSIGYTQLLGETINITDPKTGEISQTVCTDKNAPLINKENVPELIFCFDFYLNERQQFSTHCYQNNLKIFLPEIGEYMNYFIHAY